MNKLFKPSPFFPEWPGDRILIAGSSDVQDKRVRLEATIREAVKLGPVTDEPIEPYSWDVETNAFGLDPRHSMQQSIPLPSRPQCLGVVCIMGERIGLPLDRDFAFEHVIENASVWMDKTRNYKLVHPWPDAPEDRKRELEAGGFPLTGNTFEFLCALQSQKECWIGFLCSGAPQKKENLLNRANWRTGKSNAGLTDDEYKSWVDGEYFEQTQAVRNFSAALADRSIAQHWIDGDENLNAKVRGFVVSAVLPRGKTGNPYRFLARYESTHSGRFCGRDAETKAVADLLIERLTQTQPASVGITGHSGTGKSSLLRAGVVHALGNRTHREHYQTVEISPQEDLKAIPDQPLVVLEKLLARVVHESELQLDAGELYGFGDSIIPEERAVELLIQALEKQTSNAEQCLVLAIDQLEQVVDQTSDPVGYRTWLPFLKFLDLACQSGRIGIVYTLESGRLKAAQDLNLLGVFNHDQIELDNSTDIFYRTVITEPFRRNGYPLSRNVVDSLMAQVAALRGKPSSSSYHAALPIISMLLHDLYDHVSLTREPVLQALTNIATRPDGTSLNEDLYVQPDDVEGRLNHENVIGRIIAIAMKRGGLSQDIKPEDLNGFLLPLVGVAGKDLSQTELLLTKPHAYSDDRRLTDIFLRSRLLMEVEGKVRLTHEAVLKAWPLAESWLKMEKPLLKIRHRLNHMAQQWELDDRVPQQASDTDISRAAEVLANSIPSWALISPNLTEDDALLRDYCFMVFSQASDGMQEVPRHFQSDKPPLRYVHVAASYGLTDSLDRFAQHAPECLSVSGGTSNVPVLYWAAWGSIEAIDWLLKQDYNEIDKLGRDDIETGWPAIEAAIAGGNSKIFMRLLRVMGEDPPVLPFKQTLLHQCARHNRHIFTQQLIDWFDDLDPKQPDSTGWTAVHFAAYFGSAETFELLASAVDPFTPMESSERSCVHIAAEQGQHEILSRLRNITGYAEEVNRRDSTGWLPLGLAARNGHSETVRTLLNDNDPNCARKHDNVSYNVLELAIPDAAQEIVDEDDAVLPVFEAVLNDKRANPNVVTSDGSSLLELASKLPKVVRLLLDDDGLVADAGDRTSPLLIAADLSHWSAYRRLRRSFKQEVEVAEQSSRLRKIRDNDGNSLLHHLSRPNTPSDLLREHLEVVKEEDLLASNTAGFTPVLSAIRFGNEQAFRMLLEKGTNSLDVYETPKNSAIQVALRGKSDIFVQLVIEAIPNALTKTEKHSWTIMHSLCANQQLEQIERLSEYIQSNTDCWTIKDAHGRTPVDLLRPDSRHTIPVTQEAMDWPEPKNWDSDLQWRPLSTEERSTLQGKIDPDPVQWPINAETSIDWTYLPFYTEKLQLVRLKNSGWTNPSLAVYFLQTGSELFRLNGTSVPIHLVNEIELDSKGASGETLLVLNQSNVLSYLRFFGFFVRGEEGPFLIHEMFDRSATKIVDDSNRDAIAKLEEHARPTWLFPAAPGKDGWLVSAVVWYGDALFSMWFNVPSNGFVEGLDDDPLASKLKLTTQFPLRNSEAPHTFLETRAAMLNNSIFLRREALKRLEENPEAMRDLIPQGEGWNMLHLLCANQNIETLESIIEAGHFDMEAWNATDSMGRRPIDLLNPDKRDLVPDAPSAMPWPDGKHWDSDLKWSTFSSKDRMSFLAKVTCDKDRWPATRTTSIEWSNLSFYPKAQLVRLTDSSWPTKRLSIYFLMYDDALDCLKGASPPIHAANQHVVDLENGTSTQLLELNNNNVLDYLRFFCFFVRTDDSPYWVHEIFDPSKFELGKGLEVSTQTLQHFARPTWLFEAPDQVGWQCNAIVWHKLQISSSWFHIAPDGTVTMPVDAPLDVLRDTQINLPLA